MDDAGILTWRKTTEQTCDALEKALQQAQKWAGTHASVFAPNKFQLTLFTRARKWFDIKKSIQTEWGEVKPKKTCKYLGLTMDTKMLWNEHVEEIRRKVMKTVAALSCLESLTGALAWAICEGYTKALRSRR